MQLVTKGEDSVKYYPVYHATGRKPPSFRSWLQNLLANRPELHAKGGY